MEVIKVKTQQEKSDALSVRKVVFIQEQNVPEEIEVDEHEKESIHFVAYENGEPVGAGRLRILDGYGKVERVCVLKSMRGHGVGEALMKYLEQLAVQENVTQLKLNAQTHAEPFYLKIGYETNSDVFYDAGIPHVSMEKKL
ncbi:GNAT family N-acetyltransferase [Bacillus shivajii]|uniref:GNAT family N-acetyltransferase n=1 Tax=Bacillus shivajii TaxID=1983719 RepID=UPI001CFA4918|nr:GNAT family N-acetyltransferase [Bacillus shivajii]UCZ51912.1 GNAT family N-acetyltransferase [Bacillus shivajii]